MIAGNYICEYCIPAVKITIFFLKQQTTRTNNKNTKKNIPSLNIQVKKVNTVRNISFPVFRIMQFDNSSKPQFERFRLCTHMLPKITIITIM